MAELGLEPHDWQAASRASRRAGHVSTSLSFARRFLSCDSGELANLRSARTRQTIVPPGVPRWSDLARSNPDTTDRRARLRSWPSRSRPIGFAKARPDGFVQCGVGEHNAATVGGALSTTAVLTFWADFGVFGCDEVYNQQRLNDINGAALKARADALRHRRGRGRQDPPVSGLRRSVSRLLRVEGDRPCGSQPDGSCRQGHAAHAGQRLHRDGSQQAARDPCDTTARPSFAEGLRVRVRPHRLGARRR